MKTAVPFSRELFDDIIERLASGETLSSICRTDGYPHRSTFHDWRELGEDLEKAYLNAKRDGHDSIAERLRRVAAGERAEEGQPLLSSGDVVRDKLIIDTDLKLLSKWDSGRYGDKLALAGDKDQPLTIIIRDV